MASDQSGERPIPPSDNQVPPHEKDSKGDGIPCPKSTSDKGEVCEPRLAKRIVMARIAMFIRFAKSGNVHGSAIWAYAHAHDDREATVSIFDNGGPLLPGFMTGRKNAPIEAFLSGADYRQQ